MPSKARIDRDAEVMTTISTRIYKSLAEQIIGGSLQPGEKLEEKTLATRFGVSRTPIREALRELGARGLIDLIPRRGGVVVQIGLDRLADMLDAECEIEALCARLASQRMSALEKGQLQTVHEQAHQLVQDEDESDYLALNNEFHDLICSGAHNATLGAMIRDLRDRLAPFRQTQSEPQGQRLARSHAEHSIIVEAILRGNPDDAYEAMRNHNARLSTGVLRLLRQAPKRNSAADEKPALQNSADRAEPPATKPRKRARSAARS
jgi:DNA-binding GntR family transcriptional regulator